jgi:hypothetical protein
VRGLLGRVSWAPVVSSNRRLLTTIRMLCDAGLLDVAEKVAAHGAGPKWRKTWRWRKPDEQHG